MLNRVPRLLTGDILKILSDMGHGDELLIADANFPAERFGRRVVHCPASTAVGMLDAVLDVFPLDHLESPLHLMELSPNDVCGRPPIWDDFERSLDLAGYGVDLAWHEYKAFYRAASECYAVIQTGETALYGNIILRKGVVR